MPRALRRQYLPKRDRVAGAPAAKVENLDITPGLRKPRALHRLSSETLEQIMHAVKVLNWSYRDTAVKFNVSIRLIGN